MLNGDVFTIEVPQISSGNDDSFAQPIADGCSNNTNYFTDGQWRGTCCCSCDKQTTY